MATGPLVMFEEESAEISDIIGKLLKESNAKSVYLVNKDGQLIASSGETSDIDSTSLASLTAGNIAATGGLAKLIGEQEFSILFHEGEKDNIHISIVGQRIILVVIFDENSSLNILRKTESGSAKEHLLEEISDDDIDNLFH
jgi:predicted regulator of Ras-like GTPase activity (Roadblock/LC7/MglB family)